MPNYESEYIDNNGIGKFKDSKDSKDEYPVRVKSSRHQYNEVNTLDTWEMGMLFDS